MKNLIKLILLCLVLVSCSTGPDFKRDNPYDVDPNSGEFQKNLFPPSTSKYRFSAPGLEIYLTELPSIRYGTLQVERKNGTDEFAFFDEIEFNANTSFIDTELKDIENFGYPLAYKFTNLNSDGEPIREPFYLSIDFGQIEEFQFSESPDSIEFSWADSVYLNDGVTLFKKNGTLHEVVQHIDSKNETYTIATQELNLNTEYGLSAFKELDGNKTYLDTTYLRLRPVAPDNFSYELISDESLLLSWNDNSFTESGYEVTDLTNGKTYQLEENSTSLQVEKELEAQGSYSFSLKAYKGETYSDSISLSVRIQDYPYPEILSIESISENSFRINFRERVDFPRKVTFDVFEQYQKTVPGTQGYATLEIPESLLEFGFQFDVDLSASLSYGQYGSRSFNIGYMPAMEKISDLAVSVNDAFKQVDTRKYGDYLAYVQGDQLGLVDLKNGKLERNYSLPFNATLVRLSNRNSLVFLSDADENARILDFTSNSFSSISIGTRTIYDVSFIDDDSRIAVSSSRGVEIYDLSSSRFTDLPGFDNSAPLEFYGDASETRLLGLDRQNNQLHYFNTFDFEYFDTVDLDGAYSSENPRITNLDHFSSSRNVLAYEDGGIVEFSIGNSCDNSNICGYRYYDLFERDPNSYVQILERDLKVISTERYMRLMNYQNLNNIHVIERTPVNVSLFKLNLEHMVAVEYQLDNEQLVFYDMNRKWNFLNYGLLDREIVFPEN